LIVPGVAAETTLRANQCDAPAQGDLISRVRCEACGGVMPDPRRWPASRPLLSLSLLTAKTDTHFNPEKMSRRPEAMPQEKTEKLPHIQPESSTARTCLTKSP
jgi:hypothetical protein